LTDRQENLPPLLNFGIDLLLKEDLIKVSILLGIFSCPSEIPAPLTLKKVEFLKTLVKIKKMRINFLKERAKEFLAGAKFHFKKGNFSLVAFNLEQAYITSRYLPVEFSKYRIENMFSFVKKLIKFLKTL